MSSEDVLRAIEALQQGKTIQSYCEPGTSMVPTVRHMQPITLRPVRRPELLRRGDIVLARVEHGVYTRFVGAMQPKQGRVQIRNSHGKIVGWAPFARVYGIVTAIDGRPRRNSQYPTGQ